MTTSGQFLIEAAWLTFLAAMLLSLLPQPLQPFLLSIFHRGKLIKPSSSLPKLTVPQRWFLHFYIVGTVFNGFLLLFILAHTCLEPTFISKFEIERRHAWRTVALLLLFELHVLRRLYETIFVSKFHSHARMHVLAYLLGLLYYVLAPLSLIPRADLLIRSFFRGSHAYNNDFGKLEFNLRGENPLLQLGWCYWLSCGLFLWGSVHQYRCHIILASLRANGENKKGDTPEYNIPYGDWFEYVSSAHYFAEFVIYASFLMATGGQNLNTWLLFAFVVVNLSIAAADTHRWYRRKFDNYPPSRKAVIPFLF